MFNAYRSAFDNPSKTNEALEHNLDKVVNMTSLKLRELITKKQEAQRENSLLKGQTTVLEADIEFYTKEAKEKEEQIAQMQEEFDKTQKEIEDLDLENKQSINEYNEKAELFKQTVNSVNDEFKEISANESSEHSKKKEELKSVYEKYIDIKTSNKALMEKVYELRRQLYGLEVFIK